MRKTAITILLLATAHVFAMPQELQQAVSNVNTHLHEINSVRYSADQSISVSQGAIVDFRILKTDKRGNRSTTAYRINLRDVDPAKLTSDVQRNMMKVEVHTRNNGRYITEIEGGEVRRYVTRFDLDVRDMDNARQLMAALKEAVSTAKAMNNYKEQFGSLNEVLLELSSLVGPVADHVSEQKILVSKNRPEKLQHVVRNGTGAEFKHEFNLKDLNPTTVDYEARGKSLFIKVNTYAGKRAIKRYQDGLAKDFIENFTVDAQTVDQAQKIKMLFELAIKVANGEPLTKTHSTQKRERAKPSSSSRTKSSTQASEQKGGSYPKVELTKDPESGKYSWAGVYHVPGHSAEELFAVMNSIIPNKMVISRIDNKQIVFQRMGGNGTAMRLAGDAYLSLTFKIGFKDGKMRMQATDISYDNRAWGFSAPQTLETMKPRKLNKIVGDINERLTNGFNADMDVLKKQIRLTEEEDW